MQLLMLRCLFTAWEPKRALHVGYGSVEECQAAIQKKLILNSAENAETARK